MTIGAFDGVHRGHQEVMGHLKREAGARGLSTTVITFEPLPGEFLFPEKAPPRLMTFREKFRALEALGIDHLLCLRFNDDLRTMSPRAFVERIFVNGLNARYIAFGDDFRFGKERAGDLAFTESLASEFGYEVVPTSTYDIAGERVVVRVFAPFYSRLTLMRPPIFLEGPLNFREKSSKVSNWAVKLALQPPISR